MITSPLVLYISPQWKPTTPNSSIDKQQKHPHQSKSLDTWPNQSVSNRLNDQHKNNHRYSTINLNKNNQIIRTANDLNQILNDIQTYRNQLDDTRGSIHIQMHSSQSERCFCDQKQSTEICKQISKFTDELFQNDFVEYIYQIESLTHKTTFLNCEKNFYSINNLH